MSFRFLTAGESHGPALTGIIDGVPAGLWLSQKHFAKEMPRRKLGYGRGKRQQIEDDKVEILAGVRHGQTLGSPIALMIHNRDFEKWRDIMQVEPTKKQVERVVEVPRPGHADLVGGIKYGHSDMRNVLERASARETAMRVAIGCIARAFLAEFDIAIASRVIQIAQAQDSKPLDIDVALLNAIADESSVRCTDKAAAIAMCEAIASAKKAGDSVGGQFEVYASGTPIGLGSYRQWDKRIEGKIGQSFLSLNAIKAVEIGIGAEQAGLRGSEVHDAYAPGQAEGEVAYQSNRSGGITAGMTTGQIISVRATMKPISTLMKPLDSVSVTTGQAAKAHVERADHCAVPAAAVIAESLLALVLAEALLEKFGGDSMQEIKPRVQAWRQA